MRQPLRPHPLLAVPDFRNLGVMLRILLSLNLLLLCSAVFLPDGDTLTLRILSRASWVEPSLLLSLGLLALLSPWLARQRRGSWLVLALCMACVLVQDRLLNPLELPRLDRPLLAALLAWLLLHYFSLRQRALSPALGEARLAALQARIRPHFLFNSLNAAIALIRSRPEKAEMVLENLADLFRAQMADPGHASSLEREIELARMYLAIESERLGQRLNVVWDIQAALDASLPPLLLQPLVENAVHHGVERCGAGGEIRIRAQLKSGQLLLSVSNPLAAEAGEPHRGNRIALDNLRERLELFYDAEASLQVAAADGQYHTLIRLPYRPLSRQQQSALLH
ncbi:two-component system sensor histidine kinase AlgZ [Aquitalea magnusonii]|uniref:Two-component system sensor histidine kinase AlgZ n=2 Tax=Aquitalea magnusonii TaxID=332411 RepID=A0A318K780_9NEIS|nr:two-component system sensor histidine kinase AlgZ [Aquitalea magnusonii]